MTRLEKAQAKFRTEQTRWRGAVGKLARAQRRSGPTAAGEHSAAVDERREAFLRMAWAAVDVARALDRATKSRAAESQEGER